MRTRAEISQPTIDPPAPHPHNRPVGQVAQNRPFGQDEGADPRKHHLAPIARSRQHSRGATFETTMPPAHHDTGTLTKHRLEYRKSDRLEERNSDGFMHGRPRPAEIAIESEQKHCFGFHVRLLARCHNHQPPSMVARRHQSRTGTTGQGNVDDYITQSPLPPHPFPSQAKPTASIIWSD